MNLPRLVFLWPLAGSLVAGASESPRPSTAWDAPAAAAYLDGRQSWGWSTASLVGDWKRHDSTPLDKEPDGYATGLLTYVLQQAGRSQNDPTVARGRAWLMQHQNHTNGMWTATSLNKQRDPASDVGKFMSDAATAYAVLALTCP